MEEAIRASQIGSGHMTVIRRRGLHRNADGSCRSCSEEALPEGLYCARHQEIFDRVRGEIDSSGDSQLAERNRQRGLESSTRGMKSPKLGREEALKRAKKRSAAIARGEDV
jgi:hypothetical protein